MPQSSDAWFIEWTMLEFKDSRSCWKITMKLLFVKAEIFLVFDTYPKDFVKREFSQLRSHGCLCQLSNSIFGVFYTIAGL